MNLVRTVLSAKSIKFATVDAIRGAIVMSHTHRNVMSQPKYGQIVTNCGLTILIVSLFYLCRLRHTTQLRSGTCGSSLLKKKNSTRLGQFRESTGY